MGQSHFDHIQISTKVTTEKRTLATKMGVMKIKQTALIGLCLVTLMGAFPQNSLETTTLGPLEEECHYEDKNITEIVQEEQLVTKCVPKKQCVCGEKAVTHCLNYTTYEPQCEDFKSKECEDIPTLECKQKEVEKCKYHWEEQESENGVIVKVWAKILSSCNTTYVDMCETVIITRNKEVPDEEIITTTVEFCEDVTKTICNPIEVVKEKCATKYIQVCKEKVEDYCTEWHVLVDVPKIRTVHIKKCNDISLSSNSVEENFDENLDENFVDFIDPGLKG